MELVIDPLIMASVSRGESGSTGKVERFLLKAVLVHSGDSFRAGMF